MDLEASHSGHPIHELGRQADAALAAADKWRALQLIEQIYEVLDQEEDTRDHCPRA